jgi:N-acetylmuramoyl-L-alanine amidase
VPISFCVFDFRTHQDAGAGIWFMKKLRENSRYPLNGRSIWEVCGSRKVLITLVLAAWIGTSAMTPANTSISVSGASTGNSSLAWNADLLRNVLDQNQYAEAKHFKAEVSAIQRETSEQSATQAGTEAKDGLMCLALNIYWEARNQSVAGQLAVAQVTLNRVLDPRYSDNVCDVVYEHKQFSWYWDGKSDVPIENHAWERAYLIASAALDGSGHVALEGVTHYHAVYSKPYWKDHMVKVAKIDDHIFYID